MGRRRIFRRAGIADIIFQRHLHLVTHSLIERPGLKTKGINQRIATSPRFSLCFRLGNQLRSDIFSA